MIYIIIGSFIFIAIIVLIFVLIGINYKNKYNFLYIKVKEADNNLDILLQKKEEILLKIVPILESFGISNIPEVIKLKSKKIDHYNLYNELVVMSNDILKLIDDYESKIDFNKLSELIDKLNENENDLRATIKYYNDNSEEINYLAHKFPSNLVKILSHFQDIETYKIVKRESFEILKH